MRCSFMLFFVIGCGGAEADSSRDVVGTYDASWSAQVSFTRPLWPATTYSDTGVIMVSEGTDGRINLVWMVGANPASGTGLFEPSGDGWVAVDGTPWMGTLTNGSRQTTWCDACSLEFSGVVLTQEQTGHFEGTTPDGTSYAGTYTGTWIGTRR